jgi:PUA domain protein
MAEGKEHCVSIGITKMSTEDIAHVNKGIGIENIHFLCDGLWNMKDFHR